MRVINDIVFNKTNFITAHFKDYLVFDEIAEFMKRVYTKNEVKERVQKLLGFYTSYFKVFPNFIVLNEKEFMYKNIERKQRFIDERQHAYERYK